MDMHTGRMTVEEAGRRGGERTAKTHGRSFYQEIGRKGGQTVRRLIETGRNVQSSRLERSARRGR